MPQETVNTSNPYTKITFSYALATKWVLIITNFHVTNPMQFTKDHKIYITLRDKNRSNNSISPANNNNKFIDYIDNNIYLCFPKYYLPGLYLMKL